MNEIPNQPSSIVSGEKTFEATVLQSQEPVLALFWAPWSQPCRVLAPILVTVAEACSGMIRLVQINADDNPDLGLFYEVESIPTLLYFVRGQLRGRLVGTASKEAILSKFQLPGREGAGPNAIRINT